MITIEDWYSTPLEVVLSKLKTSRERGLSDAEVRSRLVHYGPNALPKMRRKSFLKILLKQFLGPLTLLLFIAAALAFILGDFRDSLVILIVVGINSLIGSFHEFKAERSIESLRNLAPQKCFVRREGKELELNSSEIVPGDVLILSPGMAVAADARLISSHSLLVNESALTGESLPIQKFETSLEPTTPLADRINMVYAGTFISSGRGLGVVVGTGLKNEIGKIAILATETIRPKTRLEYQIDKFGKRLILVSLGIFSFTLMIGLMRGFSFLEIFMIAVGQMVSLVPEGLPVALTIALAIGVQRLARKGTIVRDLVAVENLGAITTICCDKTGTLTKNQMTATHLYIPQLHSVLDVTGEGYDPTGEIIFKGEEITVKTNHDLLKIMEACVLCNDAQIFPPDEIINEWHISGDPTEGALLTLAMKSGLDVKNLRATHLRLSEIPFNTQDKIMTTLHEFPEKKMIFVKGAPEKIIELCSLNNEEISASSKIIKELGRSSLRLLAFAFGEIDSITNISQLKNHLHFLGFVAQRDPARPGIEKSLYECKSAGIKTVMITGDHKETGVSLAQSLGLSIDRGMVLDGLELETLSDQDLARKINQVHLFSRVSPDQKLRIIQTLQSKEEVVAMTGDGVNDAPALMKADVGIAMGRSGTDVAREAAKIILTDDNFSTIVQAISEGRLVHQNIKKLILFLFVTSIDEVLLLTLALSFGYPVPLSAIQILWINLVTEGTLTVNLVMEPLEGDEMRRDPTQINESLIDKKIIKRLPYMVLPSVIVTFGWFLIRWNQHLSIEQIRSETFTLLAFCQWFNVLNCRSANLSIFGSHLFKNRWLWGGLFVSVFLQMIVIYWPALSEFFHTKPIEGKILLQLLLISSLVLWVEEGRKIISRLTKFKD